MQPYLGSGKRGAPVEVDFEAQSPLGLEVIQGQFQHWIARSGTLDVPSRKARTQGGSKKEKRKKKDKKKERKNLSARYSRVW